MESVRALPFRRPRRRRYTGAGAGWPNVRRPLAERWIKVALGWPTIEAVRGKCTNRFKGEHELVEPLPPSVLRDVDRASGVWERLRAEGRELHFELSEQSGRLVIQIRSLDGTVLRAVAPSEALSIAAGSPV